MNDSISGKRSGMAPVPISILDFAMAGRGVSAREALAGSIKLVGLVGRRSFIRYWVAEHHAMVGGATSSPAMLLARLVGETQRIRLGAGGMMRPNFPPLVVTEQFGLLASFAPGRIDRGIGPAPRQGCASPGCIKQPALDPAPGLSQSSRRRVVQ